MKTDVGIIAILHYETTLREWEIRRPCISEMIKNRVYKDGNTDCVVLHYQKFCQHRELHMNLFNTLKIFLETIKQT